MSKVQSTGINASSKDGVSASPRIHRGLFQRVSRPTAAALLNGVLKHFPCSTALRQRVGDGARLKPALPRRTPGRIPAAKPQSTG